MIDIDDTNTVLVYTDGSCYPNPGGVGGWAFYVSYKGKQATRYGSRLDGKEGRAEPRTNNRMELSAIVQALRFVPHTSTAPLVIFTDSEYAKRCATEWGPMWSRNGWKTGTGQPAKNQTLIKEILSLLRMHTRNREVEIRWVRGHSGIPENELCDELANKGRKSGKTNWRPKKDHRTKSKTK